MQLQVCLLGAKRCPCTYREVVTTERSEAYPECTIEEYWNLRKMQCVQNKFYEHSGLREPVPCMEILRKLSAFVEAQRYQCKKNQKEVERVRVPRTASCASASLHRVQGFPVATKDRSDKGAVPGQEDWKDRGEFINSVLIFGQSSSRKFIDCGPLNSLPFFHLMKNFDTIFTKIPIMF